MTHDNKPAAMCGTAHRRRDKQAPWGEQSSVIALPNNMRVTVNVLLSQDMLICVCTAWGPVNALPRCIRYLGFASLASEIGDCERPKPCRL
jgi:hypothetical protein